MSTVEEYRREVERVRDSVTPYYPPVAVDDDSTGSPWLVCANGHRWGQIMTNVVTCRRCQDAHEFRLKGRTECEVEGCDELVTCSDALWEQGNRRCKEHWIDEGGWEAGPVCIDDIASVLAQYNPRNRWNGWLCPRMDAWSTMKVMEAVADQQDPSYEWDFDEDGTLRVVETFSDEETYTQVFEPDEDGLYDFYSHNWCWEEDADYGATDEWKQWWSDARDVWSEASNATNSQHPDTIPRHERRALNTAAADKAMAAWQQDHPEPAKYPSGASTWAVIS